MDEHLIAPDTYEDYSMLASPMVVESDDAYLSPPPSDTIVPETCNYSSPPPLDKVIPSVYAQSNEVEFSDLSDLVVPETPEHVFTEVECINSEERVRRFGELSKKIYSCSKEDSELVDQSQEKNTITSPHFESNFERCYGNSQYLVMVDHQVFGKQPDFILEYYKLMWPEHFPED
ncbi:hypothetical protein SOVF_014370 [Spinacia oleracea]|uniref:Uncharacterized protein n=1 Tax=Spinacia oleracea TaxID=3562 RepID=A0ABM3QPE9_SPIOL|nr:uncharacterized protein LOC130461244 [Spinacia oleracea]XP_056685228.1 uncharacterized protein LOC130461244 [Spinacia oleracea]KNA24568.1 hypothetical protein SOVF_014370 [Spinacia oleracea]